jgi:hypothetical protein
MWLKPNRPAGEWPIALIAISALGLVSIEDACAYIADAPESEHDIAAAPGSAL